MKAMIAMSGGVDSSAAAYLMKQQGYDCIGCTMKLFERDAEDLPGDGKASATGDVNDARAVAERLGMPFFVCSYTGEFRENVVMPFARAYLAGATPNPCVNCNRCLKFGTLLEKALAMGCDKLVSGHYVRLRYEEGKYHLYRALDPGKDQSYVLYNLTQEQLAHLAFPLGEYRKDEVRRIAEEQGFVNAHRRESQDICFVPDGDYARLIESLAGSVPPPGDFVDLEGRVLGRHKGIIHYTIGQRKGLGLALPAPLYVCRIDVEKNQVTLGPHDALFSRLVSVRDVNWISGKAPEGEIRVQAKLRYRQPPAEATAEMQEDGRVLLRFTEPQRAVTPGQSAVFYQGEELLGGGIIE